MPHEAKRITHIDGVYVHQETCVLRREQRNYVLPRAVLSHTERLYAGMRLICVLITSVVF